MEGRRMRREHVLAVCWTTGAVAALGLLAFFSGMSRLIETKAALSDGPEFRSRKLLELRHLPVQESIRAEAPRRGVALQEIPNPFPPFQYPPPAASPPPPARVPPPPVAASPPTSPSPPRSPPPPGSSQAQNRPPPPSQSSPVGAGIAPGQSASLANSPRASPRGVFRNNHAAAAAIGGGLAVVVLAVVIMAIWKGKDSGDRRHDDMRWNK